VAGYEALSRFTRGQRRNVADWFEDAHRCGMGVELELHAIRTALEVHHRPFGAYLALNVSPATLVAPELRELLPRRLDDLVLEVTGHGDAPSEEALRRARKELRARGARIAVDMSGSDYTRLRSMMWASPDVLKLDTALVQRVHADPVKAALVESLVRYARNFDVAVCGEGVELLADLQRLADLDVTYAQGHAVGRPTRPWAGVDAEAARVCRTSLAATVTATPDLDPTHLGPEARLQWLAWKLSGLTAYGELDAALAAIRADLRADELHISVIDGEDLVTVGATGPEVLRERYPIARYPATERVLREHGSAQVIVTDPDADPAEVEVLLAVGHRSVLMLPVCCGGRTIGLFEAYSRGGRPFSRWEIGRARMLALQLGATLERLGRQASPPGGSSTGRDGVAEVAPSASALAARAAAAAASES